jgi:hypothetical protein
MTLALYGQCRSPLRQVAETSQGGKSAKPVPNHSFVEEAITLVARRNRGRQGLPQFEVAGCFRLSRIAVFADLTITVASHLEMGRKSLTISR